MQKTTKRKTTEFTRGYMHGVRDLALVIEQVVTTQQLVEIYEKFTEKLQQQKAKAS